MGEDNDNVDYVDDDDDVIIFSSGQGKSMQFVDPDRIEQSDHVQAASFAI